MNASPPPNNDRKKRRKKKKENGWDGRGRGGNSSPLKETVGIQFVHQRGRYRHRPFAFVRWAFFALFYAFHRRQENTFHTFPSFLRFIHGGHGHPTSVNQCLGERERERERRVSLHNSHSLPPSLPLPHPASALSNTMQHPPIHRCFSHPHIALLAQSTTSYPTSQPHCVSSRTNMRI